MRVVLGIEYDGSDYFGWQMQPHSDVTIQNKLTQAVNFVADHPVEIFCAGRTDRGVHALGQIAHFDTTAERDERAWVLGINSRLPPDIRVQWACSVNDDFHARFSAYARRYRYVIYNHAIKPALLRNQVTTYYHPLDEKKMHAAGQYLVGEHDFSSYRAVGCQAKSPIRTVEFLTVTRRGDFIFIDIKANAFLHHMVRNMVGVLASIGSGKRNLEWAQEILIARDRTCGDVTAPPQGLYFMEVFYPEQFVFSERRSGQAIASNHWSVGPLVG